MQQTLNCVFITAFSKSRVAPDAHPEGVRGREALARHPQFARYDLE
jgi:hypothetical protein